MNKEKRDRAADVLNLIGGLKGYILSRESGAYYCSTKGAKTIVSDDTLQTLVSRAQGMYELEHKLYKERNLYDELVYGVLEQPILDAYNNCPFGEE